MASLKKSFIQFGTILFFSLALAACGGDNGAAGTDGATGAPGPSGPPGPSTGSGVPIGSTEKINIAVSSVVISAGGGAPVVSFTLSNDLEQGLRDLPAGDARFTLAQLTPGSGGGSSEWQSYVTRTSNSVANAQADAERGSAGTFVDNSDGTYEYTFASDLTSYAGGPVFDGTKTHRLGIEIRGQAPISSNGIIDFVPVGGAPLFERKIVDNDTCNACHDRLEFHGGPRTDVEYCVTCHNPSSTDEDSGNTVDMKAMIHNIHSARSDYQIVGYGNRAHDWSDLVWTQDIRNCQTCHEEDDLDTPQASNWRLVQNRAACGTCHYDDGDPSNGRNDYRIQDGDHPLMLTLTDDTQCVLCHGPNSDISDGDFRVAQVHEIPTQVASQRFQFNIEGVTNMMVGMTPTVQLSVTNPEDGSYYDLLGADGSTEFTTCGGGASRLAVSIAWNTADYTNTGSGATPAQPIALNALACFGAPGATPVPGQPGVFSVTSGTPIPANAIGTAAVTIDGHPAVVIDGVVNRIPVKNVVEYVGIDGVAAVARREVVDIANCDNCHKELSLHGNNRTDNPQVCVICHNPNATDAAKRVQLIPPTQCETQLGLDDSPIDFKYMIHAMHVSGEIDVPYNVCGYNNSAHTFEFDSPGQVANCEGCHDRGTYYPVDPGTVLGTTIDAGTNLSSPIDDTVISPNTAVCSACHVETLDAEHMKQNGGDFDATKMADSTLIADGVETCALCHGEGGIADVEEVHHVRDFPLN